MYKISEKKFYDICDKIETMEKPNNLYFPTKSEIAQLIWKVKFEDFIAMIAYYASNPYSDVNGINDNEDYIALVKYANAFLLEEVILQ